MCNSGKSTYLLLKIFCGIVMLPKVINDIEMFIFHCKLECMNPIGGASEENQNSSLSHLSAFLLG